MQEQVNKLTMGRVICNTICDEQTSSQKRKPDFYNPPDFAQ